MFHSFITLPKTRISRFIWSVEKVEVPTPHLPGCFCAVLCPGWTRPERCVLERKVGLKIRSHKY